MRYVVEVHRMMQVWRLQAEGNWRCINPDPTIKDTDRRFDTPAELQKFQQDDMEVSLGGERVVVNPTGLVQICDLCGVSFRVMRDRKPHTPTKDELWHAIRQGEDRTHNTLVIDLDGYFRLKPWTDGRRPLDDLDIAVRMETYSARNGYVGKAAAADGDHIDRTYRQYLYLWLQHVECGLMNIFEDGTPWCTEQAVLADVAASLDARFGA